MQHRSRSRVLVSGPLAMYADGFRLALARRGYRPSSIEGQLRLMAHLSCWLRTRGLAAGELTVDSRGAFRRGKAPRGPSRVGDGDAGSVAVAGASAAGRCRPARRAVVAAGSRRGDARRI